LLFLNSTLPFVVSKDFHTARPMYYVIHFCLFRATMHVDAHYSRPISLMFLWRAAVPLIGAPMHALQFTQNFYSVANRRKQLGFNRLNYNL